MKRYWISFWVCDLSKFEYHGPWWVSGQTCQDVTEYSVCAAVVAKSEKAARRVIEDSFDTGHGPGEFRFVSHRADDWEPFCDRFARAKWMKWPHPATQSEGETP